MLISDTFITPSISSLRGSCGIGSVVITVVADAVESTFVYVESGTVVFLVVAIFVIVAFVVVVIAFDVDAVVFFFVDAVAFVEIISGSSATDDVITEVAGFVIAADVVVTGLTVVDFAVVSAETTEVLVAAGLLLLKQV